MVRGVQGLSEGHRRLAELPTSPISPDRKTCKRNVWSRSARPRVNKGAPHFLRLFALGV